MTVEYWPSELTCNTLSPISLLFVIIHLHIDSPCARRGHGHGQARVYTLCINAQATHLQSSLSLHYLASSRSWSVRVLRGADCIARVLHTIQRVHDPHSIYHHSVQWISHIQRLISWSSPTIRELLYTQHRGGQFLHHTFSRAVLS